MYVCRCIFGYHRLSEGYVFSNVCSQGRRGPMWPLPMIDWTSLYSASSRHGTSLYRDTPPPASDIWWLSLETCSNLLKHVLWPQAGGRHPTEMLSCYVYRLQRSWAKVMFLQASVILSTGGGLPQCMLEYHPPLPPGPDQTPPDQAPPPPSRPPQEQTPTPPSGSRRQHTVNERPVRILLEICWQLSFL